MDVGRRLDVVKKRLDVLGINYFRGKEPPVKPANEWKPGQMSTEWHLLTWEVTDSIPKPWTCKVTFQSIEVAKAWTFDGRQ